jgi:hypothetical protein
MKTSEIHNFFVLNPIWPVPVVLASYKYLLRSNIIYYTMSHTFIIRYLFILR